MKLSDYYPNFRGILFQEVRDKVTKGGIIIPEATFSVKTFSDPTFEFDHEKEHRVDKAGDFIVVKVGKDAIDTRVGDKIILLPGFRAEPIELEEGIFFQISEQQIAGGTKEGR